uniref:Reprolysin n=1 Tax=Rhipicephalus appendiculatus TaxID=34631 RepID=A0A131YTT3_RHIAP
MKLKSSLIFAYFAFVNSCCHGANRLGYRAVVYPKLFEGRDENTKVLKINEEITLDLRPTSILREDFFVRKYRDGVPEYKYFDVKALQQDLYHDAKQLASVSVTEEDGILRVEGVVGPKLKIRPVEVSERSIYGDQAHIVDTIEDSKSNSHYGKITEDRMTISERNTNGRVGYDSSKYSVTIVYPEVLVTCDSKFLAGFKNKASMIKYVLTTFQVVTIRYSTVIKPKIKPILRGIEITNKTEEDHFYDYVGNDGIDAIPSLYKIKTYVNAKSVYYEGYDLVYFITGYDMIVVNDGKWDRAYKGFAFVGSACLSSREQLGEDIAYTYVGIRTMTHEMAHTLGCDHDGSEVEGHLPGFNANSQRCPWDDGFIMSYVIKNSNSMKFSSCCDYDLRRYTWMLGADCLHKNITKKTSSKWSKIYKLPGEFLKKDKQCQLTYPYMKKTYYMKEFGIQNCRIQCFVPKENRGGNYTSWGTDLFDGTRCDKDRKYICINGDCVKDPRPPYRKPE